MMPVIRLSDATFSELKTIATWLSAKTPSETIDRLVREKLDELGLERDSDDEPEIASNNDVMKFDKAPGLSFTRLTAAKVGGVPLKKMNWAHLLLTMIAAMKAKGLSGSKLVSELQVPAKTTQYSNEGYKYYPELGISVQGQAAQDAWKEIERIATKWAIPVEAEFQWRQHAKAQHPGRSGFLRAGVK
ncbi:T4SS efffector SepA family protein [Rhodoblastus sp.]|uniref:T4SS efffector SepA family protein n=1 Tax=Rhodoblastus sp. TaxID=1962975 RepID=UPI003F98084A